MRSFIRFLRVFWKAFERTAVQVTIIALIVILILALHVGIGPLDILLLLVFLAWLLVNFLYYRNKSESIDESALWESLFERRPKTQKEKILEFLQRTNKEFTITNLSNILGMDIRIVSRLVKELLREAKVKVRRQGKYVFVSRSSQSLIHSYGEENDYVTKIKLPDFRRIPRTGAYVGKYVKDDFRLVDVNAFFDLKRQGILNFILTGSIGSGKTVGAKVLVEEALLQGITCLIIDPTGQWNGLARACSAGRMLKRYKEFDLDYPRGFQGQILTPRENRSPNVLKRLRSGEFLTVDLSEFSSDVQRVKYTCSILQELLNFYKNKPETNELKFLVILEECHHFLREYIKEVPKDAVAILGRCMRELRKRGVGFIIISHKVTDFEGAIRTNAHTKVYFRTGYEQDIKRIGTLYGSGYAKPINILPKGVALVHFPEYNDGKPYFIAFRPLLSSHGYVKR